MQLHITGRHVEITDGIRSHVYDKVERTLADFSRIEDVRVILEVQKRGHITEILVQGKNIHIEAKASEDNMYLSMDEALHKVKRQLRKSREKVQDHHVRD